MKNILIYVKIENGIIVDKTSDPVIARMKGLVDTINYYPYLYNNKLYTREKYEEIKNSQEYKDEREEDNRVSFSIEVKQLENQACYIEYKNKKISLDEILFKSTIYNSVTDLYVYLKAEDKSLIKVLRATFLLIVAKAKSNLKDVEEALYNASYDKNKSLEDNIKAIKNIFDSINKIFND